MLLLNTQFDIEYFSIRNFSVGEKLVAIMDFVRGGEKSKNDEFSRTCAIIGAYRPKTHPVARPRS